MSVCLWSDCFNFSATLVLYMVPNSAIFFWGFTGFSRRKICIAYFTKCWGSRGCIFLYFEQDKLRIANSKLIFTTRQAILLCFKSFLFQLCFFLVMSLCIQTGILVSKALWIWHWNSNFLMFYIFFFYSQYDTGITPIMEAAISGHELIFNILLDHVSL